MVLNANYSELVHPLLPMNELKSFHPKTDIARIKVSVYNYINKVILLILRHLRFLPR